MLLIVILSLQTCGLAGGSLVLTTLLLCFAALSLLVLFMMRSMQLHWIRTCAEKGGRAPST